MFKKFRSLFSKKEECHHNMNWMEVRYLENGTPMVHFHCNDCGYDDRGMVYTHASNEEWLKTTVCANGIQREIERFEYKNDPYTS